MASSDEEDNNYDWGETEDGEREALELSRASPLLTPFIKLTSVTDACVHDEENFALNIKELCADLKVDFYGGIKLINYIRSLVKGLSPTASAPISSSQAEGIINKVKADRAWLSSDEYLKPVMKDDAYLQSIDSLIVDEDWSDSDSEAGGGGGGRGEAAAVLSVGEAELIQVKRQLAEAQAQLALMAKALYDKQEDGLISAIPTLNALPQEDDVVLNPKAVEVCSALSGSISLFEGKVVLVVSSSMGLLGMLAARSGAKQVVVLEPATLESKTSVAANNMLDKIQFVTLEELSSVVDQVDVIVGQWVSRCLLFHDMNSLISIRDQYLSKDGTMVPGRMVVQLSGCEEETVSNLSSVCGLDMSAHSKSLVKYGRALSVKDSITSSEVLLDISFEATDGRIQAEGSVELKATRSGKLGAFQLSVEASGVGQQLSTHSTTLLIDHSGGTQDELEVGACVVASYALFHDPVDTSGEFTLSLSWNQTKHQTFKILDSSMFSLSF